MSPDDLPADLTVSERDEVRHTAMNAATIILGNAQQLQRRLLRTQGLTQLELDLLLGNVTAILATTRRMADELLVLTDDGAGSQPVRPSVTTTPPDAPP